jgi:hypothetical protein
MRPAQYGANDSPVRRSLRELFDVAAAMSIAVLDQLDAEPEMARFLRAVKAHPEERTFVVGLFIDSFSDGYILKREPWEFMQFCMHALRWPEIRQFVFTRAEDDLMRRGSARSSIWNSILGAFEDSWGSDWPEFFKVFRASPESR